ncbi:hypothetical protein E8E15_003008 [Penicillium rubens]|nr:hypothetical protein E8E15_003008 [Penicillium rubens]
MESTAPTPRPPVDVSAGRVTRFRHVKLTSKFQYDLHSPNLDSFAIHFNGTVSMLAFHWEDDFALCGSIQGYSRPPATTARLTYSHSDFQSASTSIPPWPSLHTSTCR